MKFFVPLSKVEDAEDGTVRVFGVASSEAVDSDGEIIKASAMDAALPDYFRHGTGALREMHQPIAAGTVDEADVGKNGQTMISATVIDPIAVKKVKAGVYKGFSIGGKITGRDPDDRSVITALKLSEISLVDRPANPEATMNLYKLEGAQEEPEAGEAEAPAAAAAKADAEAPEEAAEPVQCWHCGIGEHTHVAKADARACIAAQALAKRNRPVDAALEALAKAEAAAGVEPEAKVEPEPVVEKKDYSADERASMASSGEALPDGSFPIKNTADLHNAIQAYGRAKDKAKAKDHIIARAKALGATSELPDDWSKSEHAANLRKGLYAVTCLGDVISTLACLIQDAEWEQAYEGDKSAVPAQLHVALDTLVQAMKDMTEEELGELMGSLKPGANADDNVDVVSLAAKLGDLAKAGARNSAADQTLIQTVHDHACALGADCAPGEEAAEMAGAKADKAEDLAKVEAERDSLLAKFADIGPRIEALTKRLAVVEAQPAMPKYLLHTVTKEEDGGGEVIGQSETDYMARLDKMSPNERNKELMKLALRVPKRLSD